MADHVTPNLPSRDFDVTEAFYAKLGFATSWKDRGWMILQRGGLQLEFFPYPDLDPATSSFGCCLRLDDLDAMVALVNGGSREKAPAGRASKAPQLGERPEDRLPDRSRLHAGAADPEPRLTACPAKIKDLRDQHRGARCDHRGAGGLCRVGVLSSVAPCGYVECRGRFDIARSWPDRHGQFVRRCG